MNNKEKSLTLELIILFTGIPALLLVFQTPALKIFILLSGTVIALLYLSGRRRQRISAIFTLNKNTFLWSKFTGRIIMVCALILLSGFLFREKYFFVVPFNPVIIPFIVIGYPLISVLPQEIIYRLFFFERYKFLLRSRFAGIIINAFLFAFMHIIYGNPLAVIFSFPGGILLSLTYLKTRSLILTAIEHTIYGYFVFLSGYGQYFLTENIFKLLFLQK